MKNIYFKFWLKNSGAFKKRQYSKMFQFEQNTFCHVLCLNLVLDPGVLLKHEIQDRGWLSLCATEIRSRGKCVCLSGISLYAFQ